MMMMYRTNMWNCFAIQTSFHKLPFCGPHTKPYGVRGFNKNYHIIFDTKLVHGICAIFRIPCAYSACTYMLYKPWIPDLAPEKQPRYRPVIDCSYWPVLGSFNNWNIITLSHKATTSENFEEIHQVVLDGISDNMASLFQSGKYGVINTTDTSTMGYYVIKFFSETCTLQEDTTFNGQIISAG